MRWHFLWNWRKLLLYSHRWLGIAGCLLFLAWFLSGIVMMYARLPAVGIAERLAMLPSLDLTTASISPSDAIEKHGLRPDLLKIGTMGQRPVYRFASGPVWTTIYADTGAKLTGLTVEDALRLTQALTAGKHGELRHEGRMVDSDQWTLGAAVRAQMPMHRISLGDEERTIVYLSERTGDFAMKTTAVSRRWGYWGAVIHYLYFTPFRRHAEFWSSSVIGLSFLGCLACATGIGAGIWRFSLNARFRRHGKTSRSPYSGFMLWHHYAGLAFGLTTFTWILSGGLSLNPFNWQSGTAPAKGQRDAFTGGPTKWRALSLDGLRAGLHALRRDHFVPKELEVVQFNERPYLSAYRPSALSEQALIAITGSKAATAAAFDKEEILQVARRAMPGASLTNSTLLRKYDSYYYDRTSSRPLPVWRFQYSDDAQTWLYFDPARGQVIQKHDRRTRLNRWLYKGLHSLDFPFLIDKRPLWDAVVIGLSLGGILLALTSLVPAWYRLRRLARRFSAGVRGQLALDRRDRHC